MRLGFLRVSSFCAFPLSFRANWKCQNGPCFWCSSSFFSLSRKREKTVPTREISTRARLVGRERCDQNAREKKTRSRRVPFLSNEFDLRKRSVCVCSRTKVVESRKARARLAKNFVWRLFPLEKKKNILAFAPFFLFFSLFWARFFLFFGKKWREILFS